MTDHKFTDNEIIHYLDCYENLGYRWCGYAIALINRQKAEIKMLKTIGDDKTSEVLRHDAAIRELHKQLETAKAEAIKEFAERLKANMSNIARMEYGGYTYFCVGYDLIDNIVKEMTEEAEL